MQQIRVVVADGHEIVRIGLTTLLSQEPDIDLVGVASNGEEVLRLVEEHRPRIAVLDYNLAGMSGEEACRSIVEGHPDVSVIMLTTFPQDEAISRTILAGAKAYVHKDVEARELKRTIRLVARGKSFLDPRIFARLTRPGTKGRLISTRPLSVREIEVLRQVANGHPNSEIARRMGVSQNTVKTYVRRALEKLGCGSRAEAAALALKRGLL